jgi:GR25 family glycosyltransferase involved in LPS biosynthesis
MIDHIYYINLKKRKNRSLFMENQLSELNFPYSRFDAIRPTLKSSSGQYFDFYKRNLFNEAKLALGESSCPSKYKMGTLGCYLSHYKLLKSLSSQPNKNILILEDDCYLNNGKSLDELKDSFSNNLIPDDWDIIRSMWSSTDEIKKINFCHPMSFSFSNNQSTNILYDVNQKYINSPNRNPVIHSLYGGTHFQLIKSNSIPKILDYLDSECLLPIDALYTTTKLNVYHSKFNIKTSRMKSDINGASKHS